MIKQLSLLPEATEALRDPVTPIYMILRILFYEKVLTLDTRWNYLYMVNWFITEVFTDLSYDNKLIVVRLATNKTK